MTMTKAELVEIICEKTAFTRQESAEFVEQVFEIIKDTLEKGKRSKSPDLGILLCGKSSREDRETSPVNFGFSRFFTGWVKKSL